MSSTTLRILISTLICLSVIAVILYIMLYFNNLQVEAGIKYPLYSIERHLPTLLYSIVPVVASELFTPMAKGLTMFEHHISEEEHHKYFVLKIFALQFINRYCSLIYAAFWLQDLSLLRSLLSMLLITNAVSSLQFSHSWVSLPMFHV
jgi:hypothetical protein